MRGRADVQGEGWNGKGHFDEGMSSRRGVDVRSRRSKGKDIAK